MRWRTFYGEPLEVPLARQVRSDVEWLVGRGRQVKVLVGSDSSTFNGVTRFATAVVIWNVGRGGHMYVGTEKVERPMNTFDRLMEEVTRSVSVAFLLVEELAALPVVLEVHVDVNPDRRFVSSRVLQQVRGYLQGVGLPYKVKPEAFASSVCANWFV